MHQIPLHVLNTAFPGGLLWWLIEKLPDCAFKLRLIHPSSVKGGPPCDIHAKTVLLNYSQLI